MISILKKIYFAFSKRERLTFFAAAFLAATSTIALTTGFIGQNTTVVPTSGGAYTEGLIGQPSYPNPVLASTETDKTLVRLLFSNVVGLSDKITPGENGKTWDIRLKENIFWSDGEKLTSDDVIFTVQKIQSSEAGSPLAPSWQGVVPKRVSELEFTLTLGNPYVFFSKNLEALYVLPKHLFAETPPANWRLSRYNLAPVGSGPYAFDSYESRADGFILFYHLKANQRFFESKPLISDFNIEFFPNAQQLVNAFNAGQIDGFGGLEPHDAVGIKRSYGAYPFSLPSYYAVFFNQNQSIALQDENARKALDAAVDRIALVQSVLDGKAEARFGPVPPTLAPGVDASSRTSIDDTRTMLDKNGWQMNGDVRQKKIKSVSVPFEFDLTVPDIPFLVETAHQLQADWRNIGAKINLVIRPAEEIANDAIKNRNYQAILFGNVLNPDADLFAFWHSSERFYPGLNLSLYNRKQADQLIETIRQTSDSDARRKKLSDLQTAITNDYPAVFLYSPSYLYFARKDLHGINPGLIDEPADRFLDVKSWYLKTARVLK